MSALRCTGPWPPTPPGPGRWRSSTGTSDIQPTMGERAGVRVGLALPQSADGYAPAAGELARFVRRAEDVGFDSLWACELTSAPILDPLALLAYTAVVITRARLGVAVLLTALRAPYRLAR